MNTTTFFIELFHGRRLIKRRLKKTAAEEEPIWALIDRKLRDETTPCRNISLLRDRGIDIWCNLLPVIYQEIVASMPMRFAGKRWYNASLSRCS
ncbi:hypothetical protein TNCV_675511 [Trichonephila clavipes]|nr:hypothetical protein TNCV_675511 [Trichonephila clavipes]